MTGPTYTTPKPFSSTPCKQTPIWRRLSTARCSAAPQLSEKRKPDWAGDNTLSKVVNAAIGFKPLYHVMKVAAKEVLRQSGERYGVPWRQRVKELSSTREVYCIKDEMENKSLEYPSYYLLPFHAYDNGNLDWTAAFEAESATVTMAIRTWKDPLLSPQQALDKLRARNFRRIEEFQQRHETRKFQQILDVGCSVGVSSRMFAARYPNAAVTGLDLSPHFLAVAELQERSADLSERQRVKYVHALGEQTGFPDASFDLVTSGYVIHECPPFATENMIKEAFRLLRPNGMLAIIDNDPRSKTLQNLPPAIFTLMKSTEPWSDLYYQMDVEAALRAAGFKHVVTEETNHRHRAVMGVKLL